MCLLHCILKFFYRKWVADKLPQEADETGYEVPIATKATPYQGYLLSAFCDFYFRIAFH